MSTECCCRGDTPSDKGRKSTGISYSGDNISFEELNRGVMTMFPDADDVFSKDGISKQSLLLSMQYIALATHHEIKATYPGGHSIIFHCGVSITSRRKGRGNRVKQPTGTGQRQQESEASDKQQGTRSTEIQASGKTHFQKKPCKFYLCFVPKGKGLWVLKDDRRNCVTSGCFDTNCPNICCNREFISTLISRHLPTFCSDRRNHTIDQLLQSLHNQFWFVPNRQTLYTAWNKALEVDTESVLLQNRKVEDYLRQLNKNGQYASLLYSNGEFVVPNLDGNAVVKDLSFNNITGLSCPTSFDMDKPFWDSLPERAVGEEKKVHLHDV